MTELFGHFRSKSGAKFCAQQLLLFWQTALFAFFLHLGLFQEIIDSHAIVEVVPTVAISSGLPTECLILTAQVRVLSPTPRLVIQNAVNKTTVPLHHIMTHIAVHVIHLTAEIPRHFLALVLGTVLRRVDMHWHSSCQLTFP